ncbi:MAG: Hint domain-containing protein [Pseudorhodobacter sp.]|nr:Hint domain-containing protein [Pseudorhodobacter sp.]
MPTTYTDQFFVIDPGNPPASGTALTTGPISYIDQDNNGYISPSGNDSAGGLDITSVWVGDTITVVMNGVTKTITGVTFYRAGGPAIFTPTDGTILQDATFVSSTYVTKSTQIKVNKFGPPCFTPGTMIRTPSGERAVESLRPGDLVVTRDHGAQPLRWCGSRTVSGLGRFAPIRFAPGVLGNSRALLVSPQHRMLLGGWRAELLFGQDEVLVAARHLVDGGRVQVQPVAEVTYLHLLFDRHEIIEAEGVPSESFHPGDAILAGDAELRAEILALFPELAQVGGRTAWPTARCVLRAHEARLLARAA